MRITLTGSWIRSRKLNRLSTWQKINFKTHFVVFLSRRCQNVENVHETFINTFLDYRVQSVPQVSSETSLCRLVQNMPSALIRREEDKVEFLETQLRSEKFSFVHKKESEHSFELSISICFFYRRISILKCKTLVLKTTT